VPDQAPIIAAAERVRNEFCRLDVLIQNAAISNTSKRAGQATRPSNERLEEMHAVWDTNKSGVGVRIVNVSSGVGSLATNLDAADADRRIFGPVYLASKMALNAVMVAMALELESEAISANVRTSRRALARLCASRDWAPTARPGRSPAGRARPSRVDRDCPAYPRTRAVLAVNRQIRISPCTTAR
jgi:NADP-dependent 3-hydroxy acid dehydrogenase YdfG